MTFTRTKCKTFTLNVMWKKCRSIDKILGLLTPKDPSVPTRSSTVHFDCNNVSIRTVKILKIVITSSHIILKEDHTVRVIKNSPRYF